MPANRAQYHITTSYNTYHPVHTARSYFNVSFLACPHPHSSSPQITRASSHVFSLGFVLEFLLLARFCAGFLFFWLSFLWAGSVGNSCFWHFVFVCCSFCKFLSIFSIFEKFSFWLFVFCPASSRAASTLAIGARQRLLWLISFSPLVSVCTAETLHLSIHPHDTFTCNHPPPHTHTLHTACPYWNVKIR